MSPYRAVALALLLVGCGPSPEAIQLATTAAKATSQLSPLLLGIMRAENDACLARPAPERAPCVEKVRARWAPVRAELEAVRAAWCAAEPEKCR